jgi:hypothetical protein
MMTVRFSCWLLVFLCMGMALGGCTHTRVEMVNEIKEYTLPADVITGTGLIYVVDAPSAPFSTRGAVYLDGEDDAAEIGFLSRGTYIFFYVPPGYHRITMPQCSPYEIVIEVEEGDILFLQPVMGGNRNSLIQIDGVMGRYYVKHLKPGDF